MPHIMPSLVRSAALVGIVGVLLLGPPVGQGPLGSAAAQEVVSLDFRTALEPYGTWHRNRRFGEVWVPANLSRSWRPYTVGHWVYTDDYGWYWVADDQEADWGWIAFHYGRWYHDPDEGWIWIPSNVWCPAWVDWRYGDQYVGWAPEPPDEFVVEVQDSPTYWSFVTTADLVAPSLVTVLLPFERRVEFFRNTALVNRPVMMLRSGRQFAVNPGIAPSNIAAIRGRPLPTFNVRPRVLAGTVGVPGAIQVRPADLRREREFGNRPGTRERIATRDIIRPSSTVIRPARSTAQPQLQSLARGEAGRLGAAPPRAARGATVVQNTAQRVPATPSAQQQRGAQNQTATPQRGREPEQRNITPPNGPPRPTVQALPSPRPGTAEQPAAGGGRNQQPTAVQREPATRPPAVAARPPPPPVVARPPVNRPPPVAAAPRPAPPPAAMARPPVSRPPPVAAAPRPAPPPAMARPPVNRPPPVAAAPRPAPPPAMARPPVNRPPPVAAAPRPAPPPAAMARAAPPVAMAPRGGPPGRRPQ